MLRPDIFDPSNLADNLQPKMWAVKWAVRLVNINYVSIYPLGYKYLLVLFTHTLGFPGPVLGFYCLCSFTA